MRGWNRGTSAQPEWASIKNRGVVGNMNDRKLPRKYGCVIPPARKNPSTMSEYERSAPLRPRTIFSRGGHECFYRRCQAAHSSTMYTKEITLAFFPPGQKKGTLDIIWTPYVRVSLYPSLYPKSASRPQGR